jgi:hypothetical protein
MSLVTEKFVKEGAYGGRGTAAPTKVVQNIHTKFWKIGGGQSEPPREITICRKRMAHRPNVLYHGKDNGKGRD